MPFVRVLENITFCSLFANPFHDFKFGGRLLISSSSRSSLRLHSLRLSLSLCGSLSSAHGGQPAWAPGPGRCRVGRLHHRLHPSEQQPSRALLSLGE